MPILFNEQTKEFHLYNDEVSYINYTTVKKFVIMTHLHIY